MSATLRVASRNASRGEAARAHDLRRFHGVQALGEGDLVAHDLPACEDVHDLLEGHRTLERVLARLQRAPHSAHEDEDAEDEGMAHETQVRELPADRLRARPGDHDERLGRGVDGTDRPPCLRPAE